MPSTLSLLPCLMHSLPPPAGALGDHGPGLRAILPGVSFYLSNALAILRLTLFLRPCLSRVSMLAPTGAFVPSTGRFISFASFVVLVRPR